MIKEYTFMFLIFYGGKNNDGVDIRYIGYGLKIWGWFF